MSTRSAVGTATGDTWRGRYVHSDGYPAHMLVELIALIRRDGSDVALKKITEDRYGWSYLDHEQEDTELPLGYQDGRFAVELGYGMAYTEVNGQSAPDEWVTADNDWDTEWVYLLGTSSVQVFAQYPSFTLKRVVSFDISDADLATAINALAGS